MTDTPLPLFPISNGRYHVQIVDWRNGKWKSVMTFNDLKQAKKKANETKPYARVVDTSPPRPAATTTSRAQSQEPSGRR